MAAQTNGNLTLVQTRMMLLLGDWHPHSISELHRCLEDDLAPLGAVRFHMCNLRKMLRPKGIDIACTRTFGTSYYQQLRQVANPYNGRT